MVVNPNQFLKKYLGSTSLQKTLSHLFLEYEKIPFLNIILKAKILFLITFTYETADLYEIIKVKGAEKQAMSLSMGLRNWQSVSKTSLRRKR